MAHRSIVIVAIQLFLMKTVHSQCVNRMVPNCGPNVVPELLMSAPAVSPLMLERPYEFAPTIIQDSSVANSLANALQLLVVSNLLSSTLPNAGCELLAPGFGPVEMLPNYAPIEVFGGGLINPYGSPYNLPGYNYIY